MNQNVNFINNVSFVVDCWKTQYSVLARYNIKGHNLFHDLSFSFYLYLITIILGFSHNIDGQILHLLIYKSLEAVVTVKETYIKSKRYIVLLETMR